MVLVIENCSTKMKDESPSPFMWLCCLPPSHTGCLSQTARYKMWPVAVHLGTKSPHFSYASNFIWMTLLPGQGLAPSPSISFFISQLQSFIFTIRIAPTQGRLAFPHIAAVLKIIITHIARFISGWTMQKIKNCNPQKSRTRTLSPNLLLRVKPVSLCEANEQASLLKAALMHESELVNCEKTPSERGLEHAAERRKHTR